MTMHKIFLAALTATFMAGATAPAFSEASFEDSQFEFGLATPQIEPASSTTYAEDTSPKTLADEAFDTSDKR